MSDTNTGGQAFPAAAFGDGTHINRHGMTMRDYFAAKAMQGLLSDSEVSGTPEEFAIRAYNMADAMIYARNAK